MAGELPFGWAPSGALTNYQPTLRERVTDWLRQSMFSDDREGQQKADRLVNVGETVLPPFGFATGMYDMGRAGGEGDYLTAGTIGAMAMMPGGKKGIRAYHGSPHSFDKFSMDKIGTGEGAQAYGHGLYFAGNEDIARHYRQALSGAPTVQYKGDDYALPAALSELKEWRTANPEGSAYLEGLRKKTMEDAAKILLENVGGGSDAPGVLRNLVNSFPSAAQDTAKGWVEQAEKLIKPHLAVNEPGHMYEVNINADPDTFLDWDKPLSEQSEAVRKAPSIAALIDEDRAYVERYPSGFGERLGANVITKVPERQLAAEGIPGIKYLDAGSRGKGVAHVQPMYKGKPYGDPIPATAWNQVDQLTQRYKDMGYDVEVKDLGTRNYVVFDDRLISIVRKYGIAGASALLGYNVMDGLSEAQAAELKQYEGGQ